MHYLSRTESTLKETTTLCLWSSVKRVLDRWRWRGVVILTGNDKAFITESLVDFAKTFISHCAGEKAILVGPKETYSIKEIYCFLPDDPNPLNSAIFSRDIDNGLSHALNLCLRMDPALILIDAPLDKNSLHTCMVAAETGRIVVVADTSGDPHAARENMLTFLSHCDDGSDAERNRELFLSLLKGIIVHTSDGTTRLIQAMDV